MDNSKSYTITLPTRFQYFKWLRYLGIILAIIYFWLTVDSYQEEGWGFTTILNGFTCLCWVGITFSYFKTPFSQSNIALSQEGITFKENKKQQSIRWSDLQSIKMTNNSLFLTLKGNIEKELNISYLEYKQLQQAKKRIRSFSEKHQIEFASKY